MPAVWRWHPLPATAVTNANSGGEDWEVVSEVSKAVEVIKVAEVIKVREGVSWKERGMAKRMYASPSTVHAKALHAGEAMDATKAVHAAEAVASETAHRAGGQGHWRGKHRHNGSASDHHFAEHGNPPERHNRPVS